MLMEFTFVNLIEESGTPRTLLCCDLCWCNTPDFSRITCDFLSAILQQTGVGPETLGQAMGTKQKFCAFLRQIILMKYDS